MRLFYRLTRERELNRDLRAIVISACAGMTGDGIKSTYAQIQDELNEVRGELSPSLRHSDTSDWTPPSADRLRRSMGLPISED